MLRPVPISESEGMIQRFYDPHRCYLEQWRFECDPPTQSQAIQGFASSVVQWKTGCGRVVGRFARELGFDVAGYDRLILCAVLPATARVTVRTTLDGVEQTPIIEARGENTGREYTGAIRGEILSHAVIEITDDGPDTGIAAVYWLGVADTERLHLAAERPNPYEGSWDDLVLPEGAEVEPVPVIGLLFGADDLDRLRRKVSAGPYAHTMGRLRSLARRCLDKEPWRGVGAYPNGWKPRGYSPDGETHIDMLAMRLGAFVGVIDRDEALCRMALDHALALAHCTHWFPHFMPHIAGSAWEQRPFCEYRFAMNAIFAWDWAGSFLTAAGREVLAQAVSTKALPWILQTLMRHPYVRGCNQGVYFAWGAVICELALASLYPYATELLDAAVGALDQSVTTYFAADGGAFEGPGYVTSTAGHALAAYALVARHRGVPLAEVVPPVLTKVGNYVKTMMSTVPPFGSAVKIADGGRAGAVFYPECLGPLAAVTGDETIAALLAGMLSEDEGQEHAKTPGRIFSIVLGPDPLPSPAAGPPVFGLLEQTGILCSNRPTPKGDVRLQLVGGPAGAGHSHDDRGSIVIEAFGEEIAIDRGQMRYNDTRCSIVSYARYHNVLIPESADEAFPRQVNPCPTDSIPGGSGDERKLECFIDVTPAWGDLAAKCTRCIQSDAPTEFLIVDEAVLPAARRVSFNLHSKFPWVRTEDGWVTRGRRAELTVVPEWTPLEETGAEDFIDGLKEPVYHLVLVSAAAVEHQLRTRLTVKTTCNESG